MRPGLERPTLTVWQVYWINGRWTSNDYLAKVYGAVFQLLGRGDDSAVLIVYTAMDRTDGAERALRAFLADNDEAIDAARMDPGRDAAHRQMHQSLHLGPVVDGPDVHRAAGGVRRPDQAGGEDGHPVVPGPRGDLQDDARRAGEAPSK